MAHQVKKKPVWRTAHPIGGGPQTRVNLTVVGSSGAGRRSYKAAEGSRIQRPASQVTSAPSFCDWHRKHRAGRPRGSYNAATVHTTYRSGRPAPKPLPSSESGHVAPGGAKGKSGAVVCDTHDRR